MDKPCDKDGCPEEATANVNAWGVKFVILRSFCAPHALEAQNLGTLLGLRVEVTPLEDTDGK